MKRSLLPVAALLALALALTGVVQAAGALQQTQTRLRAVHAAPDTGPVDVDVDGAVAFPGLSFPSVSQYIDTSPGTHNVRVVPAGQPQATPLVATTANLAANTDHSLVVVGRAGALETLLLQDDNSAPPPGQARLRLVHASPDAPPVDVAVAGGPVLFEDVAYKDVGNYVTRAAGTVSLEVREAGTNNVLLPLPNLPLNNCSVYTLFLMGLRQGQPPLQGVLSLDAITDCVPGTPAALRATAAARPTTTIVLIILLVEGRVVVIQPGVTPTATGTLTPTHTPSPTATPTESPTPTETPTMTAVPTSTPTTEATSVPTETVAPATSTPELMPTPMMATEMPPTAAMPTQEIPTAMMPTAGAQATP
jgi:hypothetical protein